MDHFVDLTHFSEQDLDQFAQQLNKLPILEENVFALKMTREKWGSFIKINPYYDNYYSSSGSVKYADINGGAASFHDVVNPFDSLHMFWKDDRFCVTSAHNVHNRFTGYLNEQESSILKEFLGTRIGFRAFYGQRKFTVETVIPVNEELINEINQRWGCDHSEKIQQWYYENNSQYCSEILRAGGNQKKVETAFYEELYVSNTSPEKTREIASRYINRENNNGHRFIPIQKRKEPVSSIHPFDYLTNRSPIMAPSDDFLEKQREENEFKHQYANEAKRYREENPGGDYSDHQYFERLRNGEE